ncbi:unnamed protein product [Owenia fusiformis]|uniref:RCC1-like domain-containing protein n=1 Tax=Owenia fusiformis TaxID=6347 RepID=A0A8S4NPQ7_OWEFU|nr:unnamed protein product [Owenia fusiformis]
MMHTVYGFGSNIFNQIDEKSSGSFEKDIVVVPCVLKSDCKCKFVKTQKKKNEAETETERSDSKNIRISTTLYVNDVSVSWHNIILRKVNGTVQSFGLCVPIKTKNISLVEQIVDDIIYTDVNTNTECFVQHNGDLNKVNLPIEISDDKDNTITNDELHRITNIASTDTCAILCKANGTVCKLSSQREDEGGGCFPQCSYIASPISCSLPIKQVSCGKEHTVMLSKFGDVLTFGSNSCGQLGNCKVDVGVVESPIVVESLCGVVITDVQAGGWHTVAVSDIGDLYVWGWNETGQLGLGFSMTQNSGETHINLQPTPTLIETNEEINFVTVACGSRHTVGLTDLGDVYTWGWNQHGQLGHGDRNTRYCPTKVEFFNEHMVCQIFAGAWNTVVIIQEKDQENS